jgi:hypothetical protein
MMAVVIPLVPIAVESAAEGADMAVRRTLRLFLPRRECSGSQQAAFDEK